MWCSCCCSRMVVLLLLFVWQSTEASACKCEGGSIASWIDANNTVHFRSPGNERPDAVDVGHCRPNNTNQDEDPFGERYLVPSQSVYTIKLTLEREMMCGLCIIVDFTNATGNVKIDHINLTKVLRNSSRPTCVEEPTVNVTNNPPTAGGNTWGMIAGITIAVMVLAVIIAYIAGVPTVLVLGAMVAGVLVIARERYDKKRNTNDISVEVTEETEFSQQSSRNIPKPSNSRNEQGIQYVLEEASSDYLHSFKENKNGDSRKTTKVCFENKKGDSCQTEPREYASFDAANTAFPRHVNPGGQQPEDTDILAAVSVDMNGNTFTRCCMEDS